MRPPRDQVRLWILASMLLVSTVAPPTLLAAESAQTQIERAEAKAIEGKAFFQAGLFDKAAESFMSAFVLSRRPDMLFNSARANEEAGKVAEAVALFELYLKQADVKDDGRNAARERIAKLKPLLPPVKPESIEGKPAPVTAPSTVTVTSPAAAAPPAAVQPVVAGPTVVAPATVAEPPAKGVSYGLCAGGGVLGLIAVASWADAVKQVDDAGKMDFGVANAATVYKQAIRDAEGQRNRSVIVGVVGLGLASWGAWRLWGAPAKATAARWWVQPEADRDGARVAFGGQF
jgi:tetratricopeptide (TPR) repeat protein